ncbi:translation elongation factor 4 [Patescibacteria group bacterium]
MENIRNFCIIAHIDHGKSTLADRFLEYTNTVAKREMKAQLLDTMDLERERGITIKLQPVRMKYIYKISNFKFQISKNPPLSPFKKGGTMEYELNLIDTPGHVDFAYEVSRSLAAVEGAILLVDATQGVEAQTLANLYFALDQNLEIIPVINKIDLPNAEVDRVKNEIINLIGCQEGEIILTSAKTGENVQQVLDRVVKKIPPPSGNSQIPLRALIFDSKYDDYKGVVANVRVVDGEIKKGDKIKMIGTGAESEILETGYLSPKPISADRLKTGEIGYIITGLKDVKKCRVGDTVTVATGHSEKVKPLPGYKELKPMVFASLFCKDGSDFNKLRDAMEKLQLNDGSLTYEPEKSQALGFGFKCGFLGLLHLDITQTRLHREYGIDLIVTVPSVAYLAHLKDGKKQIISSALDLPDPAQIDYLEEPIMTLDIITFKDYVGNVMQLVQDKRGVYKNTEYIDETRAILHYTIPLNSILIDFYDKLKSVSSGYGSLNYDFKGYEKTEVIRLDILVAEEIVEPLSMIIYKDTSYQTARKIVDELKNILPRQMFDVKIQGAIGAKIIASARISAMRKDVTAKLYGGDVSRKRKLLEKQKKGKKMMKSMGKVDIPKEAFMAILKK